MFGNFFSEIYFCHLVHFSFVPFNCVFNFNFLALVVSEIIWGPKFTLGNPASPGRPWLKDFDTPQVLAYTYIAVKFQLRSSINV